MTYDRTYLGYDHFLRGRKINEFCDRLCAGRPKIDKETSERVLHVQLNGSVARSEYDGGDFGGFEAPSGAAPISKIIDKGYRLCRRPL